MARHAYQTNTQVVSENAFQSTIQHIITFVITANNPHLWKTTEHEMTEKSKNTMKTSCKAITPVNTWLAEELIVQSLRPQSTSSPV